MNVHYEHEARPSKTHHLIQYIFALFHKILAGTFGDKRFTGLITEIRFIIGKPERSQYDKRLSVYFALYFK